MTSLYRLVNRRCVFSSASYNFKQSAETTVLAMEVLFTSLILGQVLAMYM